MPRKGWSQLDARGWAQILRGPRPRAAKWPSTASSSTGSAGPEGFCSASPTDRLHSCPFAVAQPFTCDSRCRSNCRSQAVTSRHRSSTPFALLRTRPSCHRSRINWSRAEGVAGRNTDYIDCSALSFLAPGLSRTCLSRKYDGPSRNWPK